MKHILRVLLYLLIVGVVGNAVRYWTPEPIGVLADKSPALLDHWLYRLGFYAHVVWGPIALLLGPSQFMPACRKQRIGLHRKMGYIYIVAVAFAGLAGLGIAPFASTGLVAQIGFSGLAIAWLYTTFQAFQAIKQRQVAQHRNWMVRSFALTLAAVTLRIYLPISLISGVAFSVAYPVIAWACWVPNLAVAEGLIRKKSSVPEKSISSRSQ